LASATSSASDFAGNNGLTAITIGNCASVVMAAKSRTGS